MSRPVRPKPNAGDPEGWPSRELEDPTAEIARRFVLNVRDRIGSSSLRSIDKATGVDHNTLARVLAGETWPDLVTIARLERGLRANLWPGINQ
jgi:hypothetical protein